MNKAKERFRILIFAFYNSEFLVVKALILKI